MRSKVQPYPTYLLGLLVRYRIPIYFGGLFILGLPLLLQALEIGTSGTTRTLLVILVLSVMVLTYLAERRLGIDTPQSNQSQPDSATETYSFKARALFVVAILGLGAGLYVALQVDLLFGIVIAIGAYLLGYVTYSLSTNHITSILE